jgi:hypothetical protein
MDLYKGLFLATLSGIVGVSSYTAHAGGMESGGGAAVFCSASNTAKLFDFYEAAKLRNIQIDLGGPEIDYMAKIETVLNRISSFDPARAGRYSQRVKSFMSEAKFLTGVSLPEVPDSNGLAFPSDCQLMQVAVQRKPQFPNDPYYVINKDLWDKLDNDSKAGLVLHEVIYREMREHRQKDSVKARYFNSILASSTTSKWQGTEYKHLLDLTGLDLEFLWLDTATGVFWHRVAADVDHDDCDRIASFGDLRIAYPALGRALASSGLLVGGSIDIVTAGVPGAGQSGVAELYEDKFQGTPTGLVESVMCLTKVNPLPR